MALILVEIRHVLRFYWLKFDAKNLHRLLNAQYYVVASIW
jgi:hypothetical protein